MKRVLTIVLGVMLLGFFFMVCERSNAGTEPPQHGLTLSDMSIKITSQGHVATFQLYDTVAAKELYSQLPLELELRNFRDAQWMFWPPERLNVTPQEAYHDGIRGELSYYAPWGNAFMLYRDFYARDQMHRLGINLTGIDEIANMSDSAWVEIYEQSQPSEETSMQISVQTSVGTVVFELNTSRAAKELYEQLPLTIAVEDHGRIEKVFKPPARLNTSDTPPANARIGTFAYFEPWNNVVMFYGNFGSYSGLYELGHVISGGEHIENLSGTIQIDRM